MRKLLQFLPLALCVGCAGIQGPPTLQTNLAVSSHYVFRGVVQNERPVLQGDATVALPYRDGGVLSGTVWANMDLDDSVGDAVFPGGNERDITEIDLIVDYARSFDGVSVSAGVMNYNFPNGVGGSTTEVYAGAALDDVLLSPSLTAIWDVDEVHGVYLSAAIGHGIALHEDLQLDLGASLGWASDDQAEAYFFSESGGLADFMLSAGLSYTLSERSSLTLSLGQWFLIDSDMKDAVKAAGLDTSPLVVALGYGWSL